jgi:hypothetical protein
MLFKDIIAHNSKHRIKSINKLREHTVNMLTVYVHPITYKDGSEGGWKYTSTIFSASALEGMDGQRHAPSFLPPEMRPGIHCTGSWVDPTAGPGGCGKRNPQRNSMT